MMIGLVISIDVKAGEPCQVRVAPTAPGDVYFNPPAARKLADLLIAAANEADEIEAAREARKKT